MINLIDFILTEEKKEIKIRVPLLYLPNKSN